MNGMQIENNIYLLKQLTRLQDAASIIIELAIIAMLIFPTLAFIIGMTAYMIAKRQKFEKETRNSI